MRSTMAGTEGACHARCALLTVTFTGAGWATVPFDPTARGATQQPLRDEPMLDLDPAGTIGGRHDLTVNNQLQTLQLVEVGVNVGLRMQIAARAGGSHEHAQRCNGSSPGPVVRDHGTGYATSQSVSRLRCASIPPNSWPLKRHPDCSSLQLSVDLPRHVVIRPDSEENGVEHVMLRSDQPEYVSQGWWGCVTRSRSMSQARCEVRSLGHVDSKSM